MVGVMITLAPEIAAPEGSVTCPRRAPVISCANKNADDISMNSTRTVEREHFCNFIIILPFLFRRMSMEKHPCVRKFLLRSITAGCASETPGTQHHGLTSARCGLKNRFHSAQQRNCSMTSCGRAFCCKNDYGVSLLQIQISQPGRWASA